MEFGPIFRALIHNRVRFGLIALEVGLTLAIVVNCITMLADLRSEFSEPTGMDEENLIAIIASPFGPEYAVKEFIDGVRDEDLRILRSLPGVVAATAINYLPLGGSGSARGRRPEGSDMNEIGAPFFVVGDRALQTLGVELIEGRDFDEEDFENAPNDSAPEGIRNVIVTRDLARALFPNGEALNKIIEGKGEPIQERIVGIVRLMHNAWPMESSEEKGHVTLRPGKPGDANTMQYLVRAEPGAVDDLYSQMEGLVLGVNAERTVKIRTLTEIKERTYRSSLMMIELLSAIITVLVIVTLLGIVGLTSFTVTERTRQIGVRRALGATRADILRYFLVESWIVTGIGLVLGGACAFALNYALAQVTDAPKLSPILLLGGSVLLWIAGLLAASVPALRATRVTPDLATRA